MAEGGEGRERFWEQLEKTGEAEVRLQIARGDFGDTGTRRGFAEEWIRRRDQARGDRQYRMNRNMVIASMTIATVLSVIAIVISLIALYR